MKLIERPIKLIAAFSPDGKVVPMGFVYSGRCYKVTRVQQTWESRSWEHGEILHFRLQVLGKDRHERICEVAFMREEMRWVLIKI